MSTRVAILLLSLAAACDRPSAPSPTSSSTPTPPTPASTAKGAEGDAVRGKALVTQLECARCHQGTGLPDVPRMKQCVGCHRQIIAGTFTGATKAQLGEWRKNIVHLRALPSLTGIGRMFRAEWLASFLQRPHDLRPKLPATMPRLPMSKQDADDIVAYFLARDAAPTPSAAATHGEVAAGERLFRDKGCVKCHHLLGADGGKAPRDPRGTSDAVMLAPSLRDTRDRMRRDALQLWLRDPTKLKADALMPVTSMTLEEQHHLVAYILRAPLAAPPARAIPKRLPPLTRPVTYDEVSKKVFRKICWHCHAQPDYARGDGGPGMTGGFGYAARKLDLSSYQAIASGYLDDNGKRRSVFTPAPDGTPMLLAVLLIRHAEEVDDEPRAAGMPHGMPLGLPALEPSQIQLVESWIEQGRPQ